MKKILLLVAVLMLVSAPAFAQTIGGLGLAGSFAHSGFGLSVGEVSCGTANMSVSNQSWGTAGIVDSVSLGANSQTTIANTMTGEGGSATLTGIMGTTTAGSVSIGTSSSTKDGVATGGAGGMGFGFVGAADQTTEQVIVEGFGGIWPIL